MSRRIRKSSSIISNGPPYTTVSHLCPLGVSQSSSCSKVQEFNDKFTREDIFSHMVDELQQMANMLTSVENEVVQHLNSPQATRSRSFSKSTISQEEYSEILFKKGQLIEKLTDVIETSGAADVAKCKIQCYQQLATLLSRRCEETKQDTHQQCEENRKMADESSTLNSYICSFLNLNEDGISDEDDRVRNEFHDVKQNLETVLVSALPVKEERLEFVSAVGPLVEAYVSSLDSEEDGFVELPVECLQNVGIQCLKEKCVIMQHPTNPSQFRLSIED